MLLRSQAGQSGSFASYRWILSRLNKTTDEVIKGLDETDSMKRPEALPVCLHEFCDWYLELIKPVLYGRDQSIRWRPAQQTLFTTLRPYSIAASLYALPHRRNLANRL